MAFGEVGLSPSTPDTPGTRRALQALSHSARIHGRARGCEEPPQPSQVLLPVAFPSLSSPVSLKIFPISFLALSRAHMECRPRVSRRALQQGQSRDGCSGFLGWGCLCSASRGTPGRQCPGKQLLPCPAPAQGEGRCWGSGWQQATPSREGCPVSSVHSVARLPAVSRLRSPGPTHFTSPKIPPPLFGKGKGLESS